ncbi:flagellar protein FlaG [Thiopseudomonas denitrificans]|uniref:Flagellar protein FlaG n=1 Tax=Thiopseudomonas denitrificans TaxID=1501432 RepID=A0A4R6TWQ4_9GAMM|nr:flagellar protein FlaG [Thiopseudomonas denitrificans]TDQ36693.1 flagellar protein FlaG [Thiopseudomonas denitrificans]
MDINTIGGGLPATTSRQASEVVEFRPLGSGKARQDVRQEESVFSKGALEQNREQLEELAEDIQQATRVMQRNLNFSVDDSTGFTVIKVTDALSGDVIRQMPTEDALRLAERLDEMRSLLFKAQA